MNTLPEPDSDQIALALALAERIRTRIAAAGGALRFDQFMQAALYEPGLGYYVAGQRRFGAQGDFVTAPELSPLYGRCVAVQIASWLEAGAPPVIWEFGAGSGALPAQIILALTESGRPPPQYRIIEVSPDLRARQQAWLSEQLPRPAFDRIEWLDRLPDRIEGVVLANEVLDAMPVRVFEYAQDRVFEGAVGLQGDRFQWRLQPAEAAFDAAVRERLAASSWPLAAFGSGYRSELGEQAWAWVQTVGERLVHGALLIIDYGFPTREFFHPQRRTGSLNCHYRHRSHDDPFWWPGLCDITAHVDFGAVHEAARATGLELLGYTSQAQFLLGCDLVKLFSKWVPDEAVARVRATQALQQLVSEAEMGELFKVIAFGRGLPDSAAIGLAGRDRSATLVL
jgi:SAM-dependent MidA family methyltransferase